jgi:hypothetical protein
MNRPPVVSGMPGGEKPKPNILGWLMFRPKEMTSIHYLCMPYNPRPPLYMYFSSPPPFEGPGHPYPYVKVRNCCWGTCSAGPQMVALPAMPAPGLPINPQPGSGVMPADVGPATGPRPGSALP